MPPAWSLDLMLGPTEAEQAQQQQNKKLHIDDRTHRPQYLPCHTGPQPPSSQRRADRSPTKRTSPQGQGRGSQRLQRWRPRVPCPLPGSSIALRRSSDLLCRAGVEGDVFTLQHHEGGWQEVRAAGWRQRQERTRFGQPSRSRVSGSPLHVGRVRASAWRGSSTQGATREHQDVVGASLRAPDTGRAGRVGNDVSRGRLLRSTSAREAGTHSVCHERHDGGVAATLGHDEGDSAPFAQAPQHASFEIMTKQMTVQRVHVALSRAQGEKRKHWCDDDTHDARKRGRWCFGAETLGDIDSRAIETHVTWGTSFTSCPSAWWATSTLVTGRCAVQLLASLGALRLAANGPDPFERTHADSSCNRLFWDGSARYLPLSFIRSLLALTIDRCWAYLKTSTAKKHRNNSTTYRRERLLSAISTCICIGI